MTAGGARRYNFPKSLPRGAMIGQTISHYRILAKLGEGGMGVVYKAEDTKLKRTVALKFLHPEALESPEHKTRFLHEAQAAAALAHPNVCTIYEIDEVDGRSFIAMEFVEGLSVKQKIEARPLKLEEALDIAIQVAEGLQAAHEQGVVHRDIKPSNLIVTSRSQVKIMDFGLAQLIERTRITETGTKMGTPAYMSPEQVQGEAVDRRTDVWSLGVLFYEMVSGRLPFKGDREAAVAYAVLHQEPEPLTALRSGLPLELDRVVQKALAKSPQGRYQHAEEMIVDLRGVVKKLDIGQPTSLRPSTSAKAPDPAGPVASAANWKMYVALAALLVLALAGWGTAWWRSKSEPGQEIPYRQFMVQPRGFHVVGGLYVVNRPVISPDGRYIAYLGMGSSLWVYDLTNSDDRKIEGIKIEGIESEGWFSWSPDSRWICYVSTGQLFKNSMDGGAPQKLADIVWPGFSGSSWSPDGKAIVFSTGVPARLYQIPSNGGRPEPLSEPDAASGEPISYENPCFVRNGSRNRLLVYAQLGAEGGSSIVAEDLDSGERREVVSGAWGWPFYSSSGHLLLKGGGQYFALSFSAKTLQAQGDPFPISGRMMSRGFASVSRDGTLVYAESHPGLQQLVWVNRQGIKVGAIGDAHPGIDRPRLSADGRRIVASVRGEDYQENLWVYDLRRESSVPLTFDGGSSPAWTPDARRIVYLGPSGISVKSADGSGESKPLLLTGDAYPFDVSRDGRLVYDDLATTPGGSDILYAQIGQDGKLGEPVPFAKTNFDELSPALSPDGRYLAYESNESGRYEVYLQPFPRGGRKEKASTQGGRQPRWRGDGKELFYVENNSLLVAVSVILSPEISVGGRQELFREPNLVGRGHTYEVAPDGQRFVVAKTLDDSGQIEGFRIVQNWLAPFTTDRP
jgi:eukaryotic-like serine/threonine-protein kinase